MRTFSFIGTSLMCLLVMMIGLGTIIYTINLWSILTGNERIVGIICGIITSVVGISMGYLNYKTGALK